MLGVGSELRGDDAAGVLVARRLEVFCSLARPRRLAAFVGASAPENVTGPIARFAPSHLLLVDAADLGRPPGEVELVPRDRIDGLAFCTHMLPAPILLGYLEQTIGCACAVLGIQPAQTGVLEQPSPPVARAVRRVVAELEAAFGG